MERILVCSGLVIRQTNYAEADRVLTIFTRELGIICALAKGARKPRSHQGAAAQLLCYGQFTLLRGRNMYTLRGASPVQTFYRIGESVEKLALAVYLCDITRALVAEAEREPQILDFLLNTLYILANKQRSLLLIKMVYELKLCALAGFGAQTEYCARCGAVNCKEGCQQAVFSVETGGILCESCAADLGVRYKISGGACAALKYISAQDTSKIFSFNVSGNVLDEMSALAESFILTHAEKEFSSLKYFKNL